MELTLRQIAEATDGVVEGDPERRVAHACTPDHVTPDGLCVVFDRAAIARADLQRAAACLAPPGVDLEGVDVVRVADPRAALVVVLELLHPRPRPAPGVHPDATVAPGARLGAEVTIGPGARVASGASLGDRVEIHANAVVGEGVEIGADSVVHPNATLLPGTRLGRRVIVHSSAVIGSDGFGYHRDGEGRYRKIPQVGGVEVEDDVEIGAGTTVDRGTIDPTVIRRGSKIDNLVQIAHNCVVGADCCVVAQAGLAGSVTLGDGVQLGGQAGVLDHVHIAPGARIAAGSGVTEDLGSGNWLGSPALPNLRGARILALLARLPELREELRDVRQRCERLERELAGGPVDPGTTER